jgi:hypothetical protein
MLPGTVIRKIGNGSRGLPRPLERSGVALTLTSFRYQNGNLLRKTVMIKGGVGMGLQTDREP